MSLKVEKLENSMAKLTIEVSAEELDKAIEKAYHKNKNKIAIPGFRKGKAPRQIIEKMYGKNFFHNDAVDEIANLAYLMNEETENIGARRLHTILEILLEDISYNLPDPDIQEVTINREYVQDRLREKIKEVDVDKYIL